MEFLENIFGMKTSRNTAEEKYRGNYGNQPTITFEELSELNVDEVVKLDHFTSDKLEWRIAKKTADRIVFRVVMHKGATLINHRHDCKEIILVLRGAILNKIDKRIFEKARALEIPPYALHNLVALEDSIAYIEFKNPKTNETMVHG